MSSIIFFFLFIPILSCILLGFNFLLAPHNPYKEKKTPFECGYHSFLSQNRTQFTISFFIFALLFLIFDLEIVLIYPYSVSSYANNIYGLIVMIVFTLIVTVGFIFELGKNALKIESKQTENFKSVSVKNKNFYSTIVLEIESPPKPYLFVKKPLQSDFKISFWARVTIFITLLCLSIHYKLPLSFIFDSLHLHSAIYVLSAVLVILVSIIRTNLSQQIWSFKWVNYRMSFLLLVILALLDFYGYLDTVKTEILSIIPFLFHSDINEMKEILSLKNIRTFWKHDDLKKLSCFKKWLYIFKYSINNIKMNNTPLLLNHCKTIIAHSTAEKKFIANSFFMEEDRSEAGPSQQGKANPKPSWLEDTSSTVGLTEAQKLQCLISAINTLEENAHINSAAKALKDPNIKLISIVKDIIIDKKDGEDWTAIYNRLEKKGAVTNSEKLRNLLKSVSIEKGAQLDQEVPSGPTVLSLEDKIKMMSKFEQQSLLEEAIRKLEEPEVSSSNPVSDYIKDLKTRDLIDWVRKRPDVKQWLSQYSIYGTKASPILTNYLRVYLDQVKKELETMNLAETSSKRKYVEELTGETSKKTKTISENVLKEISKDIFKKS